MPLPLKSLTFALAALLAVPAVRAADPAHLPPAVAESILHASGVYLLRAHEADGKVRYTVEAVWRHVPASGPAPVVGADFPDVSLQYPEVIVFVFKPRLQGRVGRQGIGVVNGFVPRFQLPVDDVRALIETTTWKPSPAVR